MQALLFFRNGKIPLSFSLRSQHFFLSIPDLLFSDCARSELVFLSG